MNPVLIQVIEATPNDDERDEDDCGRFIEWMGDASGDGAFRSKLISSRKRDQKLLVELAWSTPS
jgi:hypothetical protein